MSLLAAAAFVALVGSVVIALRVLSRSWLDAPALAGYLLALQTVPAALVWLSGGAVHDGLAVGVERSIALGQVTVLLALFYAVVILTLTMSPRPARLLGRFLPRISMNSPSRDALLVITTVLSAVTVLISVALVERFGGFAQALFMIRSGGGLSGHLYVKIVYILSVYLSAVLLSMMVLDKRSGRPAILSPRGLAVITLFGANLAAVSVLGDRDLIAGPIVLVLLTYFVILRGWGFVRFSAVAAVLVLGIGVLGDVRQVLKVDAADTRSAGIEWSGVGLTRQAALIVPFNSSLSITTRSDWSEGETALQDYWYGLLGVVPRSIWQDKPQAIPSGIRIKNEIGGVQQSHSGWPVWPPVLALRNGGIPLVLLVGLATGMLIGALQERYEDHFRNPFSLMMILIVTLKLVGGGVRDSFFANILLFVVPFLLVGWCVHLFAALGKRSEARA